MCVHHIKNGKDSEMVEMIEEDCGEDLTTVIEDIKDEILYY